MTNNYYNPFEGHEQEMYEDWLESKRKKYNDIMSDFEHGCYYHGNAKDMTFEQYLREECRR